MSTISRRAFLKTVGVGALSVAAMSVLAGCEGTGSTGTSTGAAKPVTGKAGVQYQISNDVAVRTVKKPMGSAAEFLDTLDVDLSAGYTPDTNDVATIYKNAYVAKAKALGATAYANLTTEQIAECEAAGEKAVANMDDVEQDLWFHVFNNTGAPIFLATASDASNTSGCVFLANCNGASINCELNTVVVNGNSEQGLSDFVCCTVSVPANAEEFNVVVTAPDATAVVTYTYVNTGYVDLSKLDASTFTF